MNDLYSLSLLALLWLGYGALHSLLASNTIKSYISHRWSGLEKTYRLLYNLIALILFVPPLLLTYHWQSEPLWRWTGIWGWFADGAALFAIAGFFWSLRYYDGAAFLGLRQWRTAAQEDTLCLSPLHRHVRHPWYFFGLVLIWTRDMDPAFLVSAIALTVYIVIGAHLEERKLIASHGEAYRRYRRQVPGLLPLPWKYLDRSTANELQRLAGQQK